MCVPAYGVPRVVVCGWRAASGSSGSDGFGGIPPCAAEGGNTCISAASLVGDPSVRGGRRPKLGSRARPAIRPSPGNRASGRDRQTPPYGPVRDAQPAGCAPDGGPRGRAAAHDPGKGPPAVGRARRTGPGAAACLAEGPGTGHAVRMSRTAHGANLGKATGTGPDRTRTEPNRTRQGQNGPEPNHKERKEPQ